MLNQMLFYYGLTMGECIVCYSLPVPFSVLYMFMTDKQKWLKTLELADGFILTFNIVDHVIKVLNSFIMSNQLEMLQNLSILEV